MVCNLSPGLPGRLSLRSHRSHQLLGHPHILHLVKIIVKISTFMQRTILYLITYCGWSGHFNNQDDYLLIISGNRYIDPA